MLNFNPYQMRTLLLFIGILFVCSQSFAQELKCDVKISSPQLQTADPKNIKALESAITDFMNNNKWTDNDFKEEEKINVTININIKEDISNTKFKADFLIQATRPIYMSSEKTRLITHNDKDVTFDYEGTESIEFSESNFRDNLSSVLSFYAYIIIGLDFDSFSAYGGSDYFQIAQNIVNTVPPSAAAANRGWRARDGQRNRYWLIESILNPRVKPMRLALYNYHRKGLDMMHDDVTTATANVADAMNTINQVNQSYPNSMIMSTFALSKSDEVLDIFLGASPQQKRQIYATMVKIDAANASKYRGLR